MANYLDDFDYPRKSVTLEVMSWEGHVETVFEELDSLEVFGFGV